MQFRPAATRAPRTASLGFPHEPPPRAAGTRQRCGAHLPLLRAAAAPVAASARERVHLLMVEQAGCIYCLRWDQEVGVAYPKSPQGRFAPLVRRPLGHADVRRLRRPRSPPTFVVIDGAREVGRIVGYPVPTSSGGARPDPGSCRLRGGARRAAAGPQRASWRTIDRLLSAAAPLDCAARTRRRPCSQLTRRDFAKGLAARKPLHPRVACSGALRSRMER